MELAARPPGRAGGVAATAAGGATKAEIGTGRAIADADALVTTKAALTPGTPRASDSSRTTAAGGATNAALTPGPRLAAGPGDAAEGVAHTEATGTGGSRTPRTLVRRSEAPTAARHAGTQTQPKEQLTNRRRLHCPVRPAITDPASLRTDFRFF